MHAFELLLGHVDVHRVGLNVLLGAHRAGTPPPGVDAVHLLIHEAQVDRIGGQQERVGGRLGVSRGEHTLQLPLLGPHVDLHPDERKGALPFADNPRRAHQPREFDPIVQGGRIGRRAHIRAFDHDLPRGPHQRVVERVDAIGHEVQRVRGRPGIGAAFGRGHPHGGTSGRDPVRKRAHARLVAIVLDLRPAESRTGGTHAPHVALRDEPLIVRVVEHLVRGDAHARLGIADVVIQDQQALVREMLRTVCEQAVPLPLAGGIDHAAHVGIASTGRRDDRAKARRVRAADHAGDDDGTGLATLCSGPGGAHERREDRKTGEGPGANHGQRSDRLIEPPRPRSSRSTVTTFRFGSARKPTPRISLPSGSVSTNAESDMIWLSLAS